MGNHGLLYTCGSTNPTVFMCCVQTQRAMVDVGCSEAQSTMQKASHDVETYVCGGYLVYALLFSEAGGIPRDLRLMRSLLFLLLSFSKLLTLFCSLLGELHNKGERVGSFVLYHDASIEYFTIQYFPLLPHTINVLLVFVLFPLLLLLCPMRSFQRCLGDCTRIRW